MASVFIRRLRIRLHTRNEQAEALQQRCSTWFHSRLEHDLSVWLAPFAGEDDVLREPGQLLIRVGEVPLSRFESTMSERIMKALKEQLSAGQWSSTHDGQEPVSPGPDAISPYVTEPRLSSMYFGQLLHFLDTGNIPDPRPWFRPARRDAWLAEALEYATLPSLPQKQGSDSSRVALALRMLRPQARRRLAETWTVRALDKLSGWLIAPMHLPHLNRSGAASLLIFPALIALQQYLTASDYTNLRSATQHGPVPGRILQTLSGDISGWPETRPPDRSGQRHEDALRPMAQSLSGPSSRSGSRAEPLRQPENISSPVDLSLVRWFGALTEQVLPALLQEHLNAWLCDPAHTDFIVPHLETLPDDIRQRLHGMLSSPRAIPPSRIGNASRVAPGRQTQKTRLPAMQQPSPVLSRKARAYAEDIPSSIIVANAGLVLLWPLLPGLFSAAGWLDNGHFIDDTARWQAVGALDWLVWGDNTLAEWRAPCPRLLCGIPEEVPFTACPPDAEQQVALDTWLTRAFATVPHLECCSVNDLRGFFLQRPGTLDAGERLILTVEPEAIDVLLYHLPWPLTQVILPWLPTPVTVDWIS